jgi:hypothetical protein
MRVYLLIAPAKLWLATVSYSRWLNRSSLICGLGSLLMLAACGGDTPSAKSANTAPQTDPAIATQPAPITSDPNAITGNTADAAPEPDRDRRSKVAPTREPAAPASAPLAADPNSANSANPAQPLTSPSSGVPDVLIPALDTLRAQTQIPVLLPDRLPLPDDPIYASARAEADRYAIDLGYVPDCRGNACMIGTITARRGSGDYYEVDESFAQTIELADGTAAYFNPSVCGASCAPPVLEWEYGGARYRVELKGLSEAEALGALATLANSAIAAGDRLR